MAISSGLVDSFKKELLLGLHDFSSNTFKIALYSSSADLDASTTAYTTTGEATGTAYSAGGETLSIATSPTISSGVAILSFSTVSWASSTITARGALIYNSTNSNRAVMVLDFGSDRSSSSSTFSVTFPSATADNAIIRII